MKKTNRQISFWVLLALLPLSVAFGVLPPGEYTFDWLDGGCWLEANQASVNAILEDVAAVTGIPIVVDPSDDSVITVSLEDRDLEVLIKAIASGSTIVYAQDQETGEYIVESIRTTTSVDAVIKARQNRERVVAAERLERQMPVTFERPVRYSGIGARVLLTPDRKGLWLRPISEQTAAFKVGIRVGDMATEIDGKPVGDFEHLRDVVQAIKGRAGSVVTLKIRLPDGTEVLRSMRRQAVAVPASSTRTTR